MQRVTLALLAVLGSGCFSEPERSMSYEGGIVVDPEMDSEDEEEPSEEDEEEPSAPEPENEPSEPDPEPEEEMCAETCFEPTKGIHFPAEDQISVTQCAGPAGPESPVVFDEPIRFEIETTVECIPSEEANAWDECNVYPLDLVGDFEAQVLYTCEQNLVERGCALDSTHFAYGATELCVNHLISHLAFSQHKIHLQYSHMQYTTECYAAEKVTCPG